MIGERSLGGVLYYHLARSYPDGATAKRVFDRLQQIGAKRKGKLDLGVYRIVPFGQGEPTVLALVSLSRKGIEYADNVIGGEETDAIRPDQFDALMARRVKVVAPIYESGQAKEGGQVVIRRGTRGALLSSDGSMDEQIGEG